MGKEKAIVKIAVTGGAASGKSSVCKRLEENGLKLIVLDMLAREVVMPGKRAFNRLVELFGEDILDQDGTLNRPVLRKYITRDSEIKNTVEGVVQPEILQLMNDRIEAFSRQGEAFVVVEVPLLFELGLEGVFDFSLVVTIERDIQIKRLMNRDSVSRDDAEALLNIQMSQEEKVKRADIIIENNGSYNDLVSWTDRVCEKLIENRNNLSKALDR